MGAMKSYAHVAIVIMPDWQLPNIATGGMMSSPPVATMIFV
jgi:hypothetical protein